MTANRIQEDEENKSTFDNRQNCVSGDSDWAANPFSLLAPDYVHSAQALYISWNSADAMIIFNRFRDTHPEEIRPGTEPIIEFIEGVPSVRVFHE